jgi:acetyl-CoA synthetase
MSANAVPGYETFLSTWNVQDLASQLTGNLQTGLNVCYECCDRYAGKNKTALFWEDRDGRSASYTFDELQTLSAHAYPREIEFVSALPKTPSGKIQRFLLRQQETEKVQATREQ